MKEIPITGGKFATVDDADYEELSAFKWFMNGRYVSRRRLKSENADGQQVKMHRQVIGAREGEIVDHIDCNPLNNCRSNLRICSISQNVFNRRVSKVNKIGVKGVFLNSPRRMSVQGYKTPYRAKLKVGGIVHLDKSFHSIEEAKAAYDACARQHQGEFSRS